MEIKEQKEIASKVANALNGLKPEDKIAAAIIIAAEIQREAIIKVSTEAVTEVITEAKTEIEEKLSRIKNIEETIDDNSRNVDIIKDALIYLKKKK